MTCTVLRGEYPDSSFIYRVVRLVTQNMYDDSDSVTCQSYNPPHRRYFRVRERNVKCK